MNSEELDRELILSHEVTNFGNGEDYENRIKAQVSKTTFSLFDRHEAKTKISFKRYIDGEIKITTTNKREKRETCSLGHSHIVSSTHDEYHFFTLPPHHVESFKEWLAEGIWNVTNRKDTPESKLIKECYEFLDHVKDPILRPSAQKLKSKLKNVVRPQTKVIV